MPFANTTGQIDETGIIIPINTGTWANLSNSSWSGWTGWINQPADPVIWNTPVTDLGSNTYFTITTNTVANGNVEYNIKASMTGNYAGEETTTTITAANVGNVNAIYGRYVYIQANVTNTGGLTTINQMAFTTSNYSYEIQLDDIDSSVLTANGSGKILPIDGNTIGAVKNIVITTHKTTGGSRYVVADYIADNYFEETSFPTIGAIQGKDRMTPTVLLTDYLGNSQDCVFDARIEVVPQLGYAGQNIVVR